MKSTNLRHLLFLLTSTAALHAQSLIEQDCTIQIQSTGVKLLNWTGHVGRTYFIQSSPDLANWSWAPNIEAGENRPMSYEVDGPAKAGFFRLQYTDLTAPNLEAADFDGDGLDNLEEITQRPRPTGASLNQSLQTSSAMPVPMSTRQISSISTRATLSEYIQTNPLKADTDDDGLTDKWEEDHQLDPTDNGSNNINNGPNGDPDQDGVDNAQEQSLGTDPFGNANTSDSDGDGILDIEDAMPGYGLVSWKRADECNYVLIEVDSPSTYGYAEDLNDNGEVLFPDGIWSGGNWIAQSHVPVIEVTDNGDPYEIRFGNWTNFNSSRQIMGTASFLVTDGQGAGFGSHIPAIWPSTLSSPIPLPDCMAIFWAIRHWPIGVTESGQMVSRIGNSYPQFSMETINRYSPSGTLISEFGGSNGFHPTGGDGHGSVSSSGWIASNLKRDSSSSQPAAYKVGLWDPSDHQVDLPAEANGWGYPISAKDLPDGQFVLTAGIDNGTDMTGRVFLKNPAGQFEYATQLADKKLELFAGDGTALTFDNKLWRNGELTPMADLCPRYNELLEDHHIFPIRSNKNGTYLVEIMSTNEDEWTYALLLPVEVEQEGYTSKKGIRFCRWLDAFPGGLLDPEFADKDRDRFRITIPGIIPNLTKIKIKSTGLNGAVIDGAVVAKATDGDYEVEMKQENGAMVSTWILLVSDGDDDKGYNGKGTDNGQNDQTLLADFESKIIVTLPELGNAEVEFTAQKPLGNITLDTVYLSPASDVPQDMKELIYKQVAKMQEIYRQIGVRVAWASIQGVAIPQSWLDAVPNPDPTKPNLEPANRLNASECQSARTLVKNRQVPAKHIRIGYVNAVMAPDAFSPARTAFGFTDLGTDGIMISLEEDEARFVLGVTAHEVGHTFGLDHVDPEHLLMKSPLRWNNERRDSKRFEEENFNTIKIKEAFYVPMQ